MTFTIYIRLIVEAYLFLCLQSIQTLYSFDTGDVCKIVSISSSTAICIFCIFLMASLMIINIFMNLGEESYFREFKDGLKDDRRHRFYVPIFFLRRLICVAWLVLAQSIPHGAKMGIYTFIQLLSLISISVIRPFVDPFENVIEIINEVTYMVL